MQIPKSIGDFKSIIKNLMESTEDTDLNNALKIVYTLISHDKMEIVAYKV